ncbi:pili assembly chaperone (plasmid) [Microbulbifer sp. TRSA002]|uniref:PFGI-1 class ICE element type IV pilus protein PilL2 n=1 Tax=Microbulbifer sp. TRSA002 TaxID=3243382 RepID=UPI004038FEB0
MKKNAIAVALCIFSTMATAKNNPADIGETNRIEVMQTGRYTYVKNIPPIDQLNPLKVVIKTRIPQSIETVGQTVEFLLARSGYVLADSSVLSAEAQILLNLPLPQVHRNIGPMSLDKALHTISGDAFELVVDPVHRKVAYELSTKLARNE